MSAGWRPSWGVHKPTLAINSLEDLKVAEPSMGEKYGARVLSSIALTFTLFTVVLISTWAMLVSTISATPRIDNNFLLVQRAAWTEGQAPIGAIAFTVPQAATSAGPRLVEAVGGYSGGMLVEIAAPPAADTRVADNGNLVVDDLDLGIRAPESLPGSAYDYLAVCVSGDCTPGRLIAVEPSDVVGKVSGVLGSDGFRDFTVGGR